MKKFLAIFTLIFTLLFIGNVYACGELTDVKTNVGSIVLVEDMKYVVTVPEGTTNVTITAGTPNKFVQNYEPRTVPTTSNFEIKVDGESCGYGIYTYVFQFKTVPVSNNNTQEDNHVISLPSVDSPIGDPPTQDEEQTQEPTTNAEENNDEPIDPNKPGSGNLLLKSLSIEGYDLLFDPYKYEYELEVPIEVTKLDILAIPQDQFASAIISSNAYDLKEGENLIIITLLDLNGNKNIYHIKVTRSKPKSSNNFLASVTINGYQFNFDSSTLVYTLEIGTESKLDITATAESELATVEIIGNTALKNGDVVTIRVTAEDGSKRDYIINIVRKVTIMDYWWLIIIVLAVLFIIILIVIKKQKKKNQKLGPQTIEGQKNTAGSIQEVVPQNVTPTATNNNDSSIVTPGVLQIIEPTNIEVVEETPVTQTDEETPTEVFQL